MRTSPKFMIRYPSVGTLGFLIASGTVPLIAFANVYLTEEQALQAIFPGEKFQRKSLELTAEEAKTIGDQSDERVRDHKLVAWVSTKKNVVFIDQVVGKHEFITVAVGVDAKKTVRAIEILEYRETYGYEVREAAWRKQFVGKDSSAPLKLGKDIVNISGATLSSAHVSGAVRRLLRTYEAVTSRL